MRNGPRVIDLDVIFYEDIELNTEQLTIPHALMHERLFVLYPICDLNPALMHPRLRQNMAELLQKMKLTSPPDAIGKVMPVGRKLIEWGKQTYIMGILNVTPDSFSDGGKYTADAALRHAKRMLVDGVDIIDVGACSTRPGAEQPSQEEEAARISPIVDALCSDDEIKASNCILSVDTWRASIAKLALDRGFHMVNDVSGGLGDPQMFQVAKTHDCPIILMHDRSRCSAVLDKADETTRDTNAGDIQTVARELLLIGNNALGNGIFRWNIVLDPGIGFSKGLTENMQVIRNLSYLRMPEVLLRDKSASPSVSEPGVFPYLLGVSRKSFLGAILDNEKDPEKRDGATAACTVVAISQGVDITRVHQTADCKTMCKFADYYYRTTNLL